MKLKKLLSGISALAVAASAFAGLAVTAEAATNLYTQNFENTSIDNLSITKDSKTSVRLLSNLAGNSTTFYNQYTESSSNTNNTGTLSLPSAYGTGVPIRFSMILRMTGSNTNGSTFELRDSNNTALFTFSTDSYAGKPKVNGELVNLSTAKLGNNKIGPSDYNTTGWLKFEGTVDFGASTKVIDLTVTDTTNSNNKVYNKKYVTKATDIKSLVGVIGRSNGAFAYDDIIIDQIDQSELPQNTTYIITYSIAENTTEEVVMENGLPTDIPSTRRPGYLFKGWTKDSDPTLYDDISTIPITADTTFTAQYEVDESYYEEIDTVSISGAESMIFGPDPNTAASNPYTVVISGKDGGAITESNLSKNVTDFKVEWEIDGFATTNDSPGQYCDSYGAFSVNGEGKVGTSFELRNVPMNFYGMMTAEVTYHGEKYTAKKAVAALGDKSITSDQILPEGGYPSDFDKYPDSLVGYQIKNDTYGTSFDAIVGGWAMTGSDSGTAVIADEGENKFIKITAMNTKKSHVFANKITAPSGQAIFEQDVRFNSNGGVITFTSKYPFSGTGTTNAATLSFDGTSLKLNDKYITKDNQNVTLTTTDWYHIVLSIDKTTETCYVVVKRDGAEIGSAANVAWNENSSSPTYYSIGLGNENTGTIDFDNYSAYYPAAKDESFTVTAENNKTSLSIDNTESTVLTASAATADGYPMTSKAAWSVVEPDMQSSVTITPGEGDAHTATVQAVSGAAPGTVTIQANIGGYTKTIKLNLTSTQDSIKFTQSSASVAVPLGDAPTEAGYKAIVIDGSGEEIPGKTVTYGIYDKNNTNEYTLPEEITFENGVLTVTKDASPVVFTIRATGTNSSGNSITRAINVTVHGLTFDFGAASDEPASGYTAVSPNTTYTSDRGYGISSGSVTAGGTASDGAAADYLEGAMTFKANVQKGKNYTVEIAYQGTLKTGYINSDLAGYDLGTQESFGTAKYTVAVPVDTLDLIVSGDGAKVASITITKDADKEPNAKPDIHHVGDSTAANRGSWAYKLSSRQSSYADLVNAAKFYNNGAGGRNLCTYYTQGKLASVLRAIEPGDIVMFGNNGTNGMGSSFEEDVNFYLDAAEAMGAKIIINSYTPHGAVGGYANGYDSATHTFTSYRQDSYDNIVRAIAEERKASDPNYLGFVEIGKQADKIFNAYVANYKNETNKEGTTYTSMDEAAARIIGCFSDHNHYYDDSKGYTDGLVGDLMLDGYDYNNEHIEGIVEQIVAIITGETPEPPTPVTYTVTFKAEGADDVTRTVEAGKTVTDIPAVPSKTGYTGAWDNFAAETVINADKTVTAVYTANSLQSEVNTDMADSSTDISIEKEFSNQSATVPVNTTVTISDSGAIKGGILTSESGTFTIKKGDSVITNASTVQFDDKGKMNPGDGAIIKTEYKNDKNETVSDNGYFVTKKTLGDMIKIKVDDKTVDVKIGATIDGNALFCVFVTGIPKGKTVAVSAD